MDKCGVLLWVFNVWVAVRQYTNVCLMPIYFGTAVVKRLKKTLISILWLHQVSCLLVLWLMSYVSSKREEFEKSQYVKMFFSLNLNIK